METTWLQSVFLSWITIQSGSKLHEKQMSDQCRAQNCHCCRTSISDVLMAGICCTTASVITLCIASFIVMLAMCFWSLVHGAKKFIFYHTKLSELHYFVSETAISLITACFRWHEVVWNTGTSFHKAQKYRNYLSLTNNDSNRRWNKNKDQHFKRLKHCCHIWIPVPLFLERKHF